MGLPRYLNDKYKYYLNQIVFNKDTKLLNIPIQILNDYAYTSYILKRYIESRSPSNWSHMQEKNKIECDWWFKTFFINPNPSKIKSVLKWQIKITNNIKSIDTYNPNRISDRLEKVEVEFLDTKKSLKCDYTLTRFSTSYENCVKTIQVSWFIKERVKALFDLQIKRHNSRVMLVRELEEYATKVYQSPTFPEHLRILIFRRDNHTCQECGVTLEELKKIGGQLQTDHIKAVTDGGVTSLNNGITKCAPCNRGKHHAKKYEANQNKLMQLEKEAKLKACRKSGYP